MAGEVTQLLRKTAQGDRNAERELVEIVYRELRQTAAAYLSRERRDHSLQATALVHETYLRLAGQWERDWHNRSHFFGVAAHFMRLILIDHARANRAEKRGGDLRRVDLEELDRPRLFAPDQYEAIIAVDEALTELEQLDRRAARVVELRFFADLTFQETAGVLGVSVRTAKDDWQFARVWLHRKIASEAGQSGATT